jgi:hypothetical protein
LGLLKRMEEAVLVSELEEERRKEACDWQELMEPH